jgi:hypothetical protein
MPRHIRRAGVTVQAALASERARTSAHVQAQTTRLWGPAVRARTRRQCLPSHPRHSLAAVGRAVFTTSQVSFKERIIIKILFTPRFYVSLWRRQLSSQSAWCEQELFTHGETLDKTSFDLCATHVNKVAGAEVATTEWTRPFLHASVSRQINRTPRHASHRCKHLSWVEAPKSPVLLDASGLFTPEALGKATAGSA